MRKISLSMIVVSIVLASLTTAFAADSPEAKPNVAMNASAYPLDYCLVTGEKLGEMGKPVVKMYDGREVKFCCNACVKTFEKDQAQWMKKLDTAIIASQKDNYPLETCVVTGEKLGEMGEPFNYVYENRLVRFCCGGCVKTFESDPAKYLSMIDAAQMNKMPVKEKSEKTDMQHKGTGH